MKTVWKFPLQLADVQEVELPTGAQVVFVGVVGDRLRQLNMWALVDPQQPMVKQRINICGTGHPVPDGVVYFGSMIDGNFVWHVFGPQELKSG